jgi:carboxyl-terminal processing protease
MSGYGAFRFFKNLTLHLMLFAAAVAAVAAPLHQYNDDELRLVARLASRVLVQNHYRGAAPDAAMSRRFYEQYLKELDPGRIYFTDADLAPFEARSGGICQALLKGDFGFAFELYDLFKSRNKEFREFAAEYLKHDIDFTVDEYFQIDRSKAPRPKTPGERRELWRLRLKNDVLYFRMIERMLKEEQTTGKETKLGKLEDSPAWQAKSPADRVLARLRDVGNNVDKREPVEILGMYLGALANSLGPHSGYAPPTLDDDFDIRMSLTLIGIGATLTNEDGFIKVVALIPGGPAALDGRLKVNDRIIAVTEENGESVDVIDMPVDRAVRYIRGKENSQVTLTVLPGDKGRNAHPVNIRITRKKVHLEESAAKGKIVESTDADGGKHRIGIATLPGFYLDIAALRRGDPKARRCSEDLKKILLGFKRDKVDAVVVDLRRNSGGSLPEAISCSGLFMTEGPVVQIRSRDRRELQSDNDPEQAYAGPVVVLSSKLSASSSEIFAAALRDNSRAVLVGDSRTFGKGTILQVEPLEESLSFLGRKIPAGLLTYEMAMFFRVAGGSPQQLGIPSDIVIPSLTEEMKVGEMYLDNHLPWDSIDPVKTTPCDPDLERKIPELRRRSEARVGHSRDFAVLKRRIEMYRRFRDRDKVSLNEKLRWEEYRREKDAEDAAEKLLGEDAADSADNGPDPVLDEAAHIASDLAELERNSPSRNVPE